MDPHNQPAVLGSAWMSISGGAIVGTPDLTGVVTAAVRTGTGVYKVSMNGQVTWPFGINVWILTVSGAPFVHADFWDGSVGGDLVIEVRKPDDNSLADPSGIMVSILPT